MNNFIKSLTILLHAIVITAVLSNMSVSQQSSTIQSEQNSSNFFYRLETIATTNL